MPKSTIDALVVGGGDDISPEHYDGDLEAPVRSDPERDALEIAWIKHALEAKLPILGICRGAQLINVVLGGKLHQDLRNLRQLTYNRPGLLPTKQVQLEHHSRMAMVCKQEHLRVNSLHHQAVSSTGRSLRIVGRDLDNIAQGFESEDKAIIGVQWHPEYLLYLPSQLRLFRWLVTSAQSSQAQKSPARRGF
ncbi:gamma-glutamyl-gamma-aminobutyrate hydrolase family protein [Marinobacterium sediminicola]|uniref:gamma-glutamyl-gamma-aminobutyrate hydrolase family protein n=1 Tax=Marinobacterium sediminicola TaxID=518898 RepID=UPI001EEFBBBB|nr:gamma-glutamyl-gamma-aminobutyrate hydrolase family protein [Marinobacterium sediminicola]ULG70511.1 gamma-glutamyl-gamma-aminobutyrate hydrolase family protein [Marinobacterium sediminicola]